MVVEASGDAVRQYTSLAIDQIQKAVSLARSVVVLDLAAVRDIDQRFLGLILMLRKSLKERGATLQLANTSDAVRRVIQLNALEFLFDAS